MISDGVMKIKRKKQESKETGKWDGEWLRAAERSHSQQQTVRESVNHRTESLSPHSTSVSVCCKWIDLICEMKRSCWFRTREYDMQIEPTEDQQGRK